MLQPSGLSVLERLDVADEVASGVASGQKQRRSVDASLAAYVDARKGATWYYHTPSRWLMPIFQSDHEWLTPFRDAMMGPMCHFGPMRREMLRSLACVKTGVFSADLVPSQHPISPGSSTTEPDLAR